MARLCVTLDAGEMIQRFRKSAETSKGYNPIFAKDNRRKAIVPSLEETFDHLYDCQRTVLMVAPLCIAWNCCDETSLDYLWLRLPFFGDGSGLTMQNVLADRKCQAMADERWLHHQLGDESSRESMKVLQGPRDGFWNAWYLSVHEGLCGGQEQRGYLCLHCGPLLRERDCKCGTVGSKSLMVLWPRTDKQIPVGSVQYSEFLSDPKILATKPHTDVMKGTEGQGMGGETCVRLTMRQIRHWASNTGIKAYQNAKHEPKKKRLRKH
jgi:hypothetical protein